MRCDSVRSANALEPEIELAYNHKLTRKQLREAEQIIEEHHREIVDAWRDHFRD
jgi:hypothetical protein